MAALHPFFVHFPIALLLAAMLFDFFGQMRQWASAKSSAFALQILAAVSALLAGFTGNRAESVVLGQQKLSEGIAPELVSHVGWGNSMVWIILIFVIARSFVILEKKQWALDGWIIPLGSAVLSALVIYTGLLGGELSRSILNYYILK